MTAERHPSERRATQRQVRTFLFEIRVFQFAERSPGIGGRAPRLPLSHHCGGTLHGVGAWNRAEVRVDVATARTMPVRPEAEDAAARAVTLEAHRLPFFSGSLRSA